MALMALFLSFCLFLGNSLVYSSENKVTQPPIVGKILDKIYTDGHWTSWSSRMCDAVCGNGRYFRKRLCVPTEELFAIPTCDGQSIERSPIPCEIPCAAVEKLRRWFFGPTLSLSFEKDLKDHLETVNYAFNQRVGASVELDCYNALTVEFLVNYTSSVIYWEKNGIKIQFDITRMMHRDYSILGLNDLRTSDSGVYTCNVRLSKKLSRTINVFSLIVLGEPYQLEVSAGSDVSVACNGGAISNLFTGLYVKWIVNTSRTVIKDYHINLPGKNTDDIIRVKRDYSGLWACVVRDLLHNRTWVTNAFYVKVNQNWMLEAWRSVNIFVKFGVIFGITTLVICSLLLLVHNLRFTKRRKKKSEDEKLIKNEIKEDTYLESKS